jgi:hypothetical protein
VKQNEHFLNKRETKRNITIFKVRKLKRKKNPFHEIKITTPAKRNPDSSWLYALKIIANKW